MDDGYERALEPYRVLDLTDEKGLLAGKIYADLGADDAVGAHLDGVVQFRLGIDQGRGMDVCHA